MKKDFIRDYSTAAFRFYARTGGKDKYIKDLMDDLQRAAKSSGISCPTEAAVINKERVMESRQAEFSDIEAVEKTLEMLGMCNNGGYIRQAIEMVYFKDCWKDIEKGGISDRVHYAEIHIPASERQIYYWLAKARKTFAEERGLRI